MTNFSTEWDEAAAVDHHPDAGAMPEREAIAYLIYAWDGTVGEVRTRPQYLEIADRILNCREEYYPPVR